jgi:hypothetical protein
MTFDWYDIAIKGAVNTPTATELAELCVDQPTTDNRFCENIFRATGTGFVLGDGNSVLVSLSAPKMSPTSKQQVPISRCAMLSHQVKSSAILRSI